MKKSFLLIIAILYVSGCGVYYSTKDSQTISRGVYAASSATDNSRFDLTKKYLDETKKVIVPPKKPIKITQISQTKTDAKGVKTKEVVTILPETARGDVVKVNSAEFTALLKDRDAKKAYEQGELGWKHFGDEVGEQLRKDAANQIKKDELIKKQIDQIKSLKWYRNIIWGACSIVGLLIIGYILLVVLKIGARAAL
ncbi:MAG: hypothetical protein M0P71_16920 [Melioribacteraceae bacterium]|nr:hypothetical protein [Melioribacteraceae bacterium]